ncbi:hypothetical protein V5799_025364 [Amblyomma americanum]|uniref:Uncharacterized protein n=1 Tax=Amblyomma americanum TaxID=6943 RepID=A0AAQ4E9X2_AMBAM
MTSRVMPLCSDHISDWSLQVRWAVALPDTRCSGTSSDAPPFPELSPRPEQAYHSAYSQPATGRIYDKKPFRFEVKKGRVYHWCTCGFSHMQGRNVDANEKGSAQVEDNAASHGKKNDR